MTDNNNSHNFASYDSMNISAYQIQKSKDEHQLAVFELCKGIADLLKESNPTVFNRIYDGLEEMCNRFR